jgi:hypothetical protein
LYILRGISDFFVLFRHCSDFPKHIIFKALGLAADGHVSQIYHKNAHIFISPLGGASRMETAMALTDGSALR